jgi:dTDP-4-dehydrorhamnose 3,5-epimerase
MESEGGIIYNDETIGIDWNFDADQLIISEKDIQLPTLANAKKAW